MVVMVMDGQGGGIGSAVIKALRTAVKADVEILDFFAPVREDWLKGEDQSLRSPH